MRSAVPVLLASPWPEALPLPNPGSSSLEPLPQMLFASEIDPTVAT